MKLYQSIMKMKDKEDLENTKEQKGEKQNVKWILD